MKFVLFLFLNKFIIMKLKLIIIFLFGLMAISCSSDKKMETDNDLTTANAEAKISIEGMTCEKGCAATIEKKLNSTFGIANATVNFEDNTAIVQFDNERISDDEIEEVIESINEGQYDADITDVKASKNGAKVIHSSKNDNGIDAHSFSFEIPNLFSVLKSVL